MFLRSDHVMEGAGGSGSLRFGRAAVPAPAPTPGERLAEWVGGIDWVPDLGSDLGSATWWRGAATCTALCALAFSLAPSWPHVTPAAPMLAELDASDRDEARALAIAPLALGATTGHRMAATDLVRPLTDTPERPVIDTTATLASGDALERTLTRAGVGSADAQAVADMVAARMELGELAPGTQLQLTLGRRSTKDVARPLEKLAFRARFDLAMRVDRASGGLALASVPIAIDRTPLRIQGRVGSSLYRSARSAGAPAKAVEAFIRSVAQRTSVSRIDADDRFDLIVEQARAATGEVQLGKLLYAGLQGDGAPIQLMRWEQDGKDAWFDPKGVGETRSGGAQLPVQGRLTSGFGARRHPVLGSVRFHKGLDIAAPMGAPIRAAMSGTVQLAGWHGGHGKYVKLGHGQGMATAYGHMSRIAVSNGDQVSAGQVIGYVGSTGLSTGPHVHYELWKNGVPTNPGRVTFESIQRLHGGALARFKDRLNRLLGVKSAGD